MKIDQSKGIQILSRDFLASHPADAARALAGLKSQAIAAVLSEQPSRVLLRIWRHIPAEQADRILPLLDKSTLSEFLVAMDPAECANALNRLGENDRQACMMLLPEATVIEIEGLRAYPVGTAGRVMDARVLSFRSADTVAEVRERMRKSEPRDMRLIFVVDDDRRLLFQVDIQDIALANDGKTMHELARPVRATISPFDSRDEVAGRLRQFNLELLPVVDVNQRLIGVIRHAALLRTLQEESAADLQMMVGAGRDERALSTARFSVRKRLPWMEINLATAFLAAAVVGLFEETIAKFTALAVLLPVVAGQSGNAGAQALAVTMRGLALREITVRHGFRVMWKEAKVGLMNGVAIALTTAAGVYLWSRSSGLALVIAAAMVMSMIAAGISGALIPITLSRLGQDPAQSSSIILTTVTDVAGFMSFLGLATLMAAFL
ncbi:MAG: magnesium transporter [Gammaproteobacteria bacterium]|nr:magnesium transporter [Gammaproteobacteria bacterium]